jgi:hypothetical protein
VVEYVVPSTVLAGIGTLALSILLVRIIGTKMFRNVRCKWSHNNGSCIVGTATMIMYLYSGDMNYNIGDGGEMCGWKVGKME